MISIVVPYSAVRSTCTDMWFQLKIVSLCVDGGILPKNYSMAMNVIRWSVESFVEHFSYLGKWYDSGRLD